MSSTSSVPYLSLLQVMHERRVRHAVLTSSRLSLEGIVQGTVDLAIAIDITPDNLTALVHALSDENFRFARHSPAPETKGVEVSVLTFARGDGRAGDVHVVLVPPALWHEAGAHLVWRGFDMVPVPVLPWDVLLQRDVPPRRDSRVCYVGAEVMN